MIHLNGQYMPIAEAKISPLDRGFLFGDGAYELIPVYSRRPFRLDEHLNRLEHTLEGIRLTNPLSREAWHEVVRRLVAGNEGQDQSIYIQVTRGADVKRDHPFPKGVPPTVFAMSSPLVTVVPELLKSGVACVSSADNRWLRCNLKTVSLLANVLLRQEAVDAGCAETILFRDGFLTEGAASNIFMVKDRLLLAPPKGHLMLPGITYDVVLELAQKHGLAHEVRDILEAEVRDADEIWMTSSTKEVLPVTVLDGLPVGAGKPGPVATAMYGWYQEFKHTVMRGA
ncbi:MAG: D-amino acid aminotransferase [Rhodocyclaceae bacterium]|nr:D-amino acid aminotransferase [Rhodocyclaceae bacterium]